jgi:hypothetical protein
MTHRGDEPAAMWAATLAARQVIAQSKDPRTALGRMSPTSVAYHTAWAAIEAYHGTLSREDRDQGSVDAFWARVEAGVEDISRNSARPRPGNDPDPRPGPRGLRASC